MALTTGIQQGDIALQQTVDGGDFCVENGIAEMCAGLEVAAYISLFGGNENDDGQPDNSLQYWGNFIETLPERKLRSRTQFLLRSLPITSGNLLRLENAAKEDLQWFLTLSIASSVTVAATIPGLNKIQLTIGIEAYGEEQNFTFTENWRASI